MIWIRAKVLDDRGNPSRVANHADLKAAGVSLSRIGLPKPGLQQFTTKGKATRHHWSSLIPVLSLIPIVVIAEAISRSLNVRSTPVLLCMLGTGIAFSWWLSINIWLKLFATRFVDALRPTGRCPSCLYELTRCPVEPDDCRVCPECGSAWKLTLAKPRLTW